MNSVEDLARMINDAADEALHKRGRVNILIAGKTGVGKSTLLNAVFQGNIAETGQGRPVTKTIKEYTKEGLPVHIIDTRGLEVAAYQETAAELQNLIETRSRDTDPNQHVHIAWVCVSEDSRRIEDAEKKLVELLAPHMPVIAVITKARSDGGFQSLVAQELPQARNVIRTRAVAEILDDGHTIELLGLSNLVELTMELVPEGQKNAFVAAQKVSMEQKIKRAHLAVITSATAAAAVGATPIPFSDAIALVPIQIGMLVSISVIFGLSVEKAFITNLISSGITGAGATVIGRTIVTNLLKLFPGGGQLVGSVISATTASTLTVAFGEAYIRTLALLFEKGLPPTAAQVSDAFRQQLSVVKL